jgi:hypothetical protein
VVVLILTNLLSFVKKFVKCLKPNCDKALGSMALKLMNCGLEAIDQVKLAFSEIRFSSLLRIPDRYFERMVFPGQRLLFAAPSAAQLGVCTGILATVILTDRVSCQALSVRSDAP